MTYTGVLNVLRTLGLVAIILLGMGLHAKSAFAHDSFPKTIVLTGDHAGPGRKVFDVAPGSRTGR